MFSKGEFLHFEQDRVRFGTKEILYAEMMELRPTARFMKTGWANTITIASAKTKINARWSTSTEGKTDRYLKCVAAIRYYIMPGAIARILQTLQSPVATFKIGHLVLSHSAIYYGPFYFRRKLNWTDYAGIRINKTVHPVENDPETLVETLSMPTHYSLQKRVNGGFSMVTNCPTDANYCVILPDLLRACYRSFVVNDNSPVPADKYLPAGYPELMKG